MSFNSVSAAESQISEDIKEKKKSKTIFNLNLILPHTLYIPKKEEKKTLNFLKSYRYTTKHITMNCIMLDFIKRKTCIIA